MTIIESAVWKGLPITTVRPNAVVRMLQQLKTVAEDQAFVHRTIEGLDVPNAPGVSVAPDHTHDSLTGALIPMPIAHDILGATLPAGRQSGEWALLRAILFKAQPGENFVKVSIWTSTPSECIDLLRVAVRSSTLSPGGGGGRFTLDVESGNGDLAVITAGVGVLPDALNVIWVTAWDAQYLPTDNSPGATTGRETPTRDVQSITVTSSKDQPVAIPSRTTGPGSTQVVLPGATQHLGLHSVTSFDDGMFVDDLGVSSYLLQSLALNEGRSWERLTGMPAGANAEGHTNNAQYDGHGHRGDTTTVTSSNVGAEIDHSLLSVAYGVGRGTPAVGAGHLLIDTTGATNDTWTGRLFAPTILGGTLAFQTVAEHFVRIPAVRAASLSLGTSKLNCAVMVYNDFGKSGGMTIRVTMLSAAGVASPNPVIVTSAQNELVVLTAAGLEAASTGGADTEQILRIEIQQAVSVTVACAIYGACLWFEA